ncbi:hypothetical protein D3C85_1537850 [compost metagenome]
MLYRVNFEKANLIFNASGLKVNPNDAPGFNPEISPEMGYYLEQKYFIETLLAGQEVATATPESTKGTIEIAVAEIESADKQGAWVQVK